MDWYGLNFTNPYIAFNIHTSQAMLISDVTMLISDVMDVWMLID